MAPDQDPYASPGKAEPRGRWAALLTVLGLVLLVFIVVRVGGMLAANGAEFEDRFSVEEGDTVAVLYTIRSAASGEILSSSETLGHDDGHDHDHGPAEGAVTALQFVVGSGESGFGREFENAIVGHYQGQTVRWGPIDGDRAFGGWEPIPQAFPRTYGPFELDQALDARFIQAYEQQVGPLREGDTIRVFRDFPWSQRVVERTDNSVLIRHDVRDGDSFPWEVPPSTLVLDVDEEDSSFSVRFDAREGDAFTVQPNTQNAMFFEPGSYRIAGSTEDEIILEYNPSPDPAIVGQKVVVEIRILQVQKRE